MANVLNVVIDQGANSTVNAIAKWANGDVIDVSSGYTANGGFRRHYESANIVYFDSFDLYSNGLVVAHLTGATANTANTGRFLYDIEINLTASNTTTRVQEGILTIKAGIS
jgi:hypothetical protein